MKRAILILTLLIATVTFSACGSNSNNTNKSASDKAKTTASTTNKTTPAASKTSDTESDDEVITDIDNWSHPVKEVFKAEDIKLNKVELKDNKTYAIFYISLNKDLNDENKSYYSSLMEKIAAANGYWNYEVKDENKDIDIKVKCKDKKTVDSIEYNKDSQYFLASNTSSTSSTISNDELISYLKQNVSEVSSFVDTLSKNKNVKPILYVERSPKASSSDTYLRDYYIIYVGENHTDHNVNIYRFAINKDSKQILYYDTAQNKYETLQEWRNSKK
ncbi:MULTISPECIES: hypothetical protein [Clostridium]|uniref:hypothetical protein n=1 Tax=Clostridium TaxID=1485 RepID=UPI00069FE812|nr:MULTISPECIES: hypothetical protein [Clostridium]KOF57392.1 hypothetical protein AGR56_13355 [Clostridium sp. DMHC 10]MCD2348766.1 hypothetical protein [Clostridium guangxiense]